MRPRYGSKSGMMVSWFRESGTVLRGSDGGSSTGRRVLAAPVFERVGERLVEGEARGPAGLAAELGGLSVGDGRLRRAQRGGPLAGGVGAVGPQRRVLVARAVGGPVDKTAGYVQDARRAAPLRDGVIEPAGRFEVAGPGPVRLAK